MMFMRLAHPVSAAASTSAAELMGKMHQETSADNRPIRNMIVYRKRPIRPAVVTDRLSGEIGGASTPCRLNVALGNSNQIGTEVEPLSADLRIAPRYLSR